MPKSLNKSPTKADIARAKRFLKSIIIKGKSKESAFELLMKEKYGNDWTND